MVKKLHGDLPRLQLKTLSKTSKSSYHGYALSMIPIRMLNNQHTKLETHGG
jgi:hypothetical protein